MSHRKVYTFVFISFFMGYSFLYLYPTFLYLAFSVLVLSFVFSVSRSMSLVIPSIYWPLIFSCFAMFALFCFGMAFWDLRDNSIALVLPILIVTSSLFVDLNFFKRLLVFYLIIIVLLAGIESFMQSYLYYYTVELPDGTSVDLDEKLFTATSDVFRAKSIFPGPLTLSAFMIGVSIVFRKNMPLLFVALCGGIFAVSRSSMYFISFLIVLNSLRYFSEDPKKSSFCLLFFFVISYYFLSSSSDILARVLDGVQIFGGESSTNSARMYFWLSGISEFSQYDIENIILGNSGHFRNLYNNNAESGWITILLDFGVLGAILYLAPLVHIVILSKRLDTLFAVGYLFLVNFFFTFSYGVVGSFSYWMVVVLLFDKENSRRRKLSINYRC